MVSSSSISEALSDPTARMMVSCILGFGLASLFRRICTSNTCLHIKGPNPKHVQNYRYKTGPGSHGECYTYSQIPVDCSTGQKKN